MTLRPRLRDESGQTAVELLGILPWLLLAGLGAWQILLAVSTASTTENAARSGSRALGRGEDYREAALRSLPRETRKDAQISRSGNRVTVRVDIPVLLPTVRSDAFQLSRSAELPPT
jgi:Flp pilus assembly protein TadG